MPDTPPPPTPAAPSSSTPPSGTPTSGSAPELASMVAPEYRYPDTESVPQYLRGKTAGDAAQLLNSLVESMSRGGSLPQAPPPPPPVTDDDYVTGGHLKQAQ